MKISKKRHQKLLHYYLSKRILSQEVFSVLTSLTEEEIESWLSISKFKVREYVFRLGLVLEYQKCRLSNESQNFASLRKKLGQELYLWSDTVGFNQIPSMSSTLLSGLVLLTEYNNRQAIVWSIRLGLDIPETSIDIKYPYRLTGVMHRAIGSSLSRAKVAR
ncbi:hypothetical protein LL266_15495 [Vibrio anguillarum]|nr:hypothetical protein [Vibrio anguillarum]MDT3848427.1 hypothetical protein [Vibrio anguillarum]NOI03985.1 hypothetical protein [Vibrio anguillarum]OEE41652.1 hypothetical protein A1QU_16420 [Vibrio anguillarum]OEE78013.1 hypothetical protein A1QQ_12680 [Vibrio ordalii FF-167]